MPASVFSCHRLESSELDSYAFMVTPDLHPAMAGCLAVGASCLGRPIGLALARVDRDRRVGEVFWLHVQPACRGNALGSALLRELEAAIAQEGCVLARTVYTTENPDHRAIERVLAACGWSPPQVRFHLYRADARSIQGMPLLRVKVPPEFTVFPWLDLTLGQKQAILRSQHEQPWYPEALSPFKEDENVHPVSLGLSKNGEIVGWMVAHVTGKTLRYSTLFVKREFQRTGRALGLLAEVIKRNLADPIQEGQWAVAPDNLAMWRLAERRIRPYASWVGESRWSTKRVSRVCFPS
ncbi:Acetyltransferase (GNAT) family protein [compost metagenome]